MEVDPGVHFNGRLNSLEPTINSDMNWKFIEHWTSTHNMHHLNQRSECMGTYTYGRLGMPRSTIDHVLVKEQMENKFLGMEIDENAEQLNINDHNLINVWFRIGHEETTKWEKNRYETRVWYKKDEEYLNKFEKDLE